MYINYQPQHISFLSREKQSYPKQSVQLRSSLQLLQVQPVVKAHKFVNLSWRESSIGLVNDKSINKWTSYSCDAAPAIKKLIAIKKFNHDR